MRGRRFIRNYPFGLFVCSLFIYHLSFSGKFCIKLFHYLHKSKNLRTFAGEKHIMKTSDTKNITWPSSSPKKRQALIAAKLRSRKRKQISEAAQADDADTICYQRTIQPPQAAERQRSHTAEAGEAARANRQLRSAAAYPEHELRRIVCWLLILSAEI